MRIGTTILVAAAAIAALAAPVAADAAGERLTLTAPQALVAERGLAFSQARPQVAGGAAPFSFGIAAGRLPAGVALDAATGRLAGKPTAAGSYWFVERVRDAEGAVATRRFTLVVVGPPARPDPRRSADPRPRAQL